MRKSIIKQAKNKEEAIKKGLEEINRLRKDVEIEVLEEGSTGFLGLGSKDAVVKITYDEDIDDALFDIEKEIKTSSLDGDYIKSRSDYYKKEAEATYENKTPLELDTKEKDEFTKEGQEFEENLKDIKSTEDDLGNYDILQKINSYTENSKNYHSQSEDLTKSLDEKIDSIKKNDDFLRESHDYPFADEEEKNEEEIISSQSFISDSDQEDKANQKIDDDFKIDTNKSDIVVNKQQTDIDKYYRAKELLEEILKEMHFEDVSVYGNLEGQIIKLDAKVSENDTGIAIGKGGTTLDAIELIIRKAIDSRANNLRVNVDINNYKKRRDEKIVELAADTARKVQRSQKSWNLKYMNSYERRLAHEEISKYPNVSSHSEGQEPKRYVVVEYISEEEDM